MHASACVKLLVIQKHEILIVMSGSSVSIACHVVWLKVSLGAVGL